MLLNLNKQEIYLTYAQERGIFYIKHIQSELVSINFNFIDKQLTYLKINYELFGKKL